MIRLLKMLYSNTRRGGGDGRRVVLYAVIEMKCGALGTLPNWADGLLCSSHCCSPLKSKHTHTHTHTLIFSQECSRVTDLISSESVAMKSITHTHNTTLPPQPPSDTHTYMETHMLADIPVCTDVFLCAALKVFSTLISAAAVTSALLQLCSELQTPQSGELGD